MSVIRFEPTTFTFVSVH